MLHLLLNLAVQQIPLLKVYMCVGVVCGGVCMFACLGKPEADTGCILNCYPHSGSSLWRKARSLSRKLLYSARLASQQTPRICLSLFSKSGVADPYHYAQLFKWVLGSKLRSSCLPNEHLPRSLYNLFKGRHRIASCVSKLC